MTQRVSAKYLIATLQDARARTLELVNDLDQEQLMKLPPVLILKVRVLYLQNKEKKFKKLLMNFFL